ncbi:MAG: Major carboxysome shell protein 1A [Firmicutes bacterium ADurb.Bin182]|nr:MAG: Major carboxysome shell protein 1A [Firmicutes bacterium ADurb.Bin182]
MISVGLLELNSIAKGIEAADVILKTAQTELVFARPSCPGKYQILFTGEVAAVRSSLEAGQRAGERFVVDAILIPRIHPQVVQAISGCAMPEDMKALGIMEYFSVAAAVYGADAAVKAADIDLVDIRLGTGIGGKSFVVMTGDVAAVNEAVKCGMERADQDGLTVASVVIPNPHPGVFDSLL